MKAEVPTELQTLIKGVQILEDLSLHNIEFFQFGQQLQILDSQIFIVTALSENRRSQSQLQFWVGLQHTNESTLFRLKVFGEDLPELICVEFSKKLNLLFEETRHCFEIGSRQERKNRVEMLKDSGLN